MDLLLDRIGDFVEILAWNKVGSFAFGMEYELNSQNVQRVFQRNDDSGSIFNRYRPLIEELAKLCMDTFHGTAKPVWHWSEQIGRYRVELIPESIGANSKGVALFRFEGSVNVTV